ncbi:hypothetical protein Tph_c04680 [Thermacetogenium phaeum DSM 12270]|uniref:Uncharacterized protein n=1 Tax=Thermacetogenium phaeum (strain ATCC BAA-254 / DSM 26808 / PB) TaxID=1089553 RepID=K4LFD9_THEPS|nr:hypothetical protein [Thermacetogenium phaeum]AFV10710.1 hypothetical protein Tph_c04680 [Thermacetogenium phaeum DSM 12270]MDN5375773.1 hypothetical protein [Thermacetogenium sp.]
MVGRKRRGSASLLLGMGTSFLLVMGGVGAAVFYVIASGGADFYLSRYFTWLLFVSVTCGGMVAGYSGGVGCWVPAGSIGLLWGGLTALLLTAAAPSGPGIPALLALLVLPALVSGTGALLAANRRVKKRREAPPEAG